MAEAATTPTGARTKAGEDLDTPQGLSLQIRTCGPDTPPTESPFNLFR